ncbi:hypothetical protein K469DRAFT_714505 [Zopfia rhizophila CBS 207.26]|uniref:AA1-like domain-containing protein n=1 Tax=Zopfia rhizophila CBS 207.26 TaxID=1314779 RepID=A0A6A6DNI0_9PEZI|nr:hypothetical protein K469DRAFT_714505 [Zopfia rhizophila CBS 207.26]
MHYLTFTALLLPALSFASPLTARQNPACTPTSYDITDYVYTETTDTANPDADSAHINFSFSSHFVVGAPVVDPAQGSVSCDANSSDGSGGSVPNENECSSGRRNFYFALRGPQERADFQLIHSWQCEGHEWMSSTPHRVDPLNCSDSTEGTVTTRTCTGGPDTFAPQNVRQICSTPTCP